MTRRDWRLFAGDTLSIAALTLIGFATHGESDLSFVPRMGAFFMPLVLSWFLLAPALGLFRQEVTSDPKQLWRAALAALFAAPLAAVLRGLWRSTRRPPGHRTGHEPRLLRTPAFYVMASAGYFGLCYRLWRPLPLTLSQPARALALLVGAILYDAGLALTLWGRLALGEMYNVSSSFGAQSPTPVTQLGCLFIPTLLFHSGEVFER